MTPHRARSSLLLAALLFATPLLSQPLGRSVPDSAKRGYLQHVTEMGVTVDGKSMTLAPGAVIRDQKNLIVVPAAVPREGALADYVEDKNGQLYRVWLLTPEESAKPRKASRN
jgi:hypothetical protein